MRRASSGRAPRAAFLLPLEGSGDGPPCVRHPAFGIAGRGEFPPRVRSPRLDPVSSPYGHVCQDAEGCSRFQRFENSFTDNILSQDKQIQHLLQALRQIFSVTLGARSSQPTLPVGHLLRGSV